MKGADGAMRRSIFRVVPWIGASLLTLWVASAPAAAASAHLASRVGALGSGGVSPIPPINPGQPGGGQGNPPGNYNPGGNPGQQSPGGEIPIQLGPEGPVGPQVPGQGGPDIFTPSEPPNPGIYGPPPAGGWVQQVWQVIQQGVEDGTLEDLLFLLGPEGYNSPEYGSGAGCGGYDPSAVTAGVGDLNHLGSFGNHHGVAGTTPLTIFAENGGC